MKNLVLALIIGSAVGAGLGAMVTTYFTNRCYSCVYNSTDGAFFVDDFTINDDSDSDSSGEDSDVRKEVKETSLDDRNAVVGDVLSFLSYEEIAFF